jgi:hypothetical protein
MHRNDEFGDFAVLCAAKHRVALLLKHVQWLDNLRGLLVNKVSEKPFTHWLRLHGLSRLLACGSGLKMRYRESSE